MMNGIAALALAAAALPTGAARIDPAGPKAQQAINIASEYTTEHYGAPSCRDPQPDWRYSLHQVGDTLVADIGPKRLSPLPIHIVLRASDLKVIAASRRPFDPAA